jgi:RHS repeat-associated protein
MTADTTVDGTSVTSGGDASVTGDNITSQKTYGYDKNGNQISEVDTVRGETTLCSYNVENNLTQLTKKEGEEQNIILTQTNRYNGEGQRISKTDNGRTIEYYYDGNGLLYTKEDKPVAGIGNQPDTTANMTTSFNYKDPSGDILAGARGDVAVFYHKDIRGSTTNLLDEEGQSIISYDYDEWGETKTYDSQQYMDAHNNEGVFNEICYTGGVYDATTGLYYLNARFYDPVDVRFLSEDTVRGEYDNPGSLNLYAYCENDPINYIDSSGHKKVSISLTATYGKSWASVSIKGEQKNLLCRYTKKLTFKSKAYGTHKIRYSVKKYYTNRYYPNTRNFNFKTNRWYNGIVFKILVGFYRGKDAKKVVRMRVNLFYKPNRKGKYYSAENKNLDDRGYDGEWGQGRLALGIE